MNIYGVRQIGLPLTVTSTTSGTLTTAFTEEASSATSTESLFKSVSSSLTVRGLIGKVKERLEREERRKKIDAKLTLTMIC